MNPEDSMTAIEPQSVKTIGADDQIDKLLSQGVNLNDSFVLHEPTCTICQSPAREETEQKYLETKDYGEAINLFKSKTGDTISKGVLENHMKFHHDRAIRELQKIEYIDRIKRHSSQNLTTLDRISICFAVISERLMGINSVTPTQDESVATIEKMKSAETARLMGQLNGLLKLQASILGEMKSSGELITIPTNDFIQIINDALSKVQTAREREIVKGIIDQLDALSRKAQ